MRFIGYNHDLTMVFSQLKVVLYLETNDGLVGWCLRFFRAFPQAAELRNDTEQGSFTERRPVQWRK